MLSPLPSPILPSYSIGLLLPKAINRKAKEQGDSGMSTGQTLLFFCKETEIGRWKEGGQYTNLDWVCSDVGIKWATEIAPQD